MYMPEKKGYLLFGGENNTIMHQLARMQTKHVAVSPGKKDLLKESTISTITGGLKSTAPTMATGKNDKIYIYDIGWLFYDEVFRNKQVENRDDQRQVA